MILSSLLCDKRKRPAVNGSRPPILPLAAALVLCPPVSACGRTIETRVRRPLPGPRFVRRGLMLGPGGRRAFAAATSPPGRQRPSGRRTSSSLAVLAPDPPGIRPRGPALAPRTARLRPPSPPVRLARKRRCRTSSRRRKTPAINQMSKKWCQSLFQGRPCPRAVAAPRDGAPRTALVITTEHGVGYITRPILHR